MTGMSGHRYAALAQEFDPHRPNHILPLRMQGSGRNQADLHLMRVRRKLWVKAMRDRAIWRRACWSALAAGSAQVLCDAATSPAAGPAAIARMLTTPALTLAAAVLSAAGTYVQGNVVKLRLSAN